MQAQAAGDGHTPLHEASGNPELGMIEYLLQSGGDPEALAADEATLLHYAARSNQNPAVIDFVIANGADVNTRADDGRTPLHDAAWYNANEAVVEALIDGGADIHAQDEYGRSPLHRAAEFNESVAVVQTLIDAGADLNAKDIVGASPLNRAARSNENLAVIEALLANGADLDAETMRRSVHQAAISGNPAKVRMLLRAGADPYLAALGGGTALHAAAGASGNTVHAMRALIDFGVEATVRDSSGRTPLHNVEEPENAAFLLANGADPRHRDASGNTALHRGIRFSHLDSEEVLELVALLVNAGGDVNARNENGRTPLHDASLGQVNALLAHGADINAQDEEGNTRLHLEAGCRLCVVASELVIALLDAGADATIRNAQGQTPWDLARTDEDEDFSGSDGYWRLNDARFEAPSR